MNNKTVLLKDLIETSELSVQQKINTIIKALVRTEESSRSRMLSDEILKGNFEDLEEQSIDDLITAFSTDNERVIISPVKEVKDNPIFNEEDNPERKQIKTLEYQIKTLQSQMESIEYYNNKRMNELQEVNNKLMSRLSLTKNSKLIEVSDDSINELYIRSLENNQTTYKEAFIIGGIVPKTYYKIKSEGE